MFISRRRPTTRRMRRGQLRGTCRRRAGLSLVMVMLAISTSLVVTMSFLQTQTVTLQLTRNAADAGLLVSAAQTGAAAGLQRLQSADWAGVDELLSGTVHTDGRGQVAYRVEFLPVEPSDENGTAGPMQGLQLRILSTGRRTLADGTFAGTAKAVEVVVELEPRVAGRMLVAGDEAEVTDVPANPGDYDAISQYGLFAGWGGTSLSLDPETRIEGPVRLRDGLRLFHDPRWRSSVRREYLQSVGERLGGAAGLVSPHPLTGPITFEQSPSSSTVTDLSDLQCSWSVDGTTLTLPAPDSGNWRTYRLYEGGFEYTATLVGSSLSQTTLRPTAENPLGIFYRDGSLQIRDDVQIEGTLYVTGTLDLQGDRIVFSRHRWRDSTGQLLTDDSRLWPELPVIVARQLTTEGDAQVLVDGVVITEDGFSGGGADLQWSEAESVSLTGTATAYPGQAPLSTVVLGNPAGLETVAADQTYSIWLDDGASGHWYPIAGVDQLTGRLTVVGEVDVSSPVACRIGRTRRHYLDIRGSLCGGRHDIDRAWLWAQPYWITWEFVRAAWEAMNDDRQEEGLPPVPFDEYVADGSLLSGWPGLPLDPVIHLQYAAAAASRWSPPLFQAWSSTTQHKKHSGYRWRVLSWKVLP